MYYNQRDVLLFCLYIYALSSVNFLLSVVNDDLKIFIGLIDPVLSTINTNLFLLASIFTK